MIPSVLLLEVHHLCFLFLNFSYLNSASFSLCSSFLIFLRVVSQGNKLFAQVL